MNYPYDICCTVHVGAGHNAIFFYTVWLYGKARPRPSLAAVYIK